MQMQRTEVGPLSVSELALGAMYFGTRTSEADSFALLDRYVEAGGNFIDTSNNYAFWPEGGRGGESETMLGRWIRQRGRRDELVIATKVGALPNYPGAGLKDIQGLGREAIVRSIDDSLARLQLDHVDLYYAHIDDRTVPIEETLGAFDELIRAGKVRAIGCSNYTAWRIMEAIRTSRAENLPSYVAVQHRHSYFQRRPDPAFGGASDLGAKGYGTAHSTSEEHLDLARDNPWFRIIAYSPLLQGGYSRPDRLHPDYRTPDNERRGEVLAAVARELGATRNQVVLAWMLQGTPPVIPLIAASTLDQLEENLGATALRLTPEQLRRLDFALD